MKGDSIFPSILPLIILPLTGLIFKKYIHSKVKLLVDKTNWKIDNIIFDSFENSILFWFVLFGIYLSLSQLPFQSNILDLPTIGMETINLLIKNDYEGVFIEKNNCIIIDKNETINLANSNNIFISTFKKY